jgi:hypothetical protein
MDKEKKSSLFVFLLNLSMGNVCLFCCIHVESVLVQFWFSDRLFRLRRVSFSFSFSLLDKRTMR